MRDREQVGTSSRQKQKFTHTAGSKSFACVAEAEDKLKNKKAEYVAIASSDSFVNLENIDNRIITEVLGSESSQQYMPTGSQAQAEVQRLRD
ncbi:Neural cell adhesion molecule L1 [Gossypium arboreum]|uniref:Neural cell adhesion molecule L1 n=1 Tax=Gossypium arboreum TaxID=29729 RepID=A0A0B0N366_GOSAR|nr:Neural cell adhesion molecule L1 [Gossypium arboreum]